MKKLNMINNQMTTKGSYTSSQNWIHVKSISVKRTFGALRYYQKIQKELGEYEPKSQATGDSIMDLVRNSPYSLNNEGQIITKEKL